MPTVWTGDNFNRAISLKLPSGYANSTAFASSISGDGKVVGALPFPIMVIWKLKYNDTTTTPVVITKIDVANTRQTINKIGQDSFTLMSMQSHVLDHLHNIAVAITKGRFWYTTRHQRQ